jgi:beta-lactamase regulating signal transducer with metallopeptidase domain
MDTTATAGVVTAATNAQPLNNNAVFIGGIVGGVVALLLVCGLIALIVARNRKNNRHANNNAMSANTTSPATSNYGRFSMNTEPAHLYDDVESVRASVRD